MLIQNTQEVIVEATAPKVFGSLWVSRISIDAPSPNSTATAHIELKPYNKQLSEVLDRREIIRIDDLYAKAESMPEIAAAMEAILIAVDSIHKANNQS